MHGLEYGLTDCTMLVNMFPLYHSRSLARLTDFYYLFCVWPDIECRFDTVD